MTFKEKLQIEHPERIDPYDWGGCMGCPYEYDYENNEASPCHDGTAITPALCTECWNREMPEEKSESKKAVEIGKLAAEGFEASLCKTNLSSDDAKMIQEKIYNAFGIGSDTIASFNDQLAKIVAAKDDTPRILDSGNRREFESGAVRDIQEGKGRCDLLPLDVVSEWLQDDVLTDINGFIEFNDPVYLYGALNYFEVRKDWSPHTMLLEVAKHFEEGCKKYGENNWQKGIPTHCYIDSAVRHYLKYLRGDTDEPHDRAFCWNILCCIWTCKHKPELNDYRKDSNENEE